MAEPVSYLEILRWSEERCREYLAESRWPDGPTCPKCGVPEPYMITRKSATKNTVTKLYKCRACKRQFSATVGTIFEDSKLPLSKWMAAIAMMCASKKGVSALQISRMLEVDHKSAWFVMHRIREAMRDKMPMPLTGTIEADETYIGGKPRGHRKNQQRRQDDFMITETGVEPVKSQSKVRPKQVVFGILERDGKVRTKHVPDAKARTLRPLMLQHINTDNSRLMTDEAQVYQRISHDLPHQIVRHEVEYVRGEVHTNGIENYWSNLKRGLFGTFHHVDAAYLGRYLDEFEFRFNRRQVSDAERFAALVGQTRGTRLTWYCQTEQPENPFA